MPHCVVVQVREATSNDPWGPSSSLMSEIADLTYNVVAFSEIMSMVWKRLNDHGKNWRHVYKVCVSAIFSQNHFMSLPTLHSVAFVRLDARTLACLAFLIRLYQQWYLLL